MRRYAIGDIHGCFYTLLDLLNKLHLEPNDKLIFVGDYIDRGPHSKQVVEYVKDMVEGGKAIALMGNHEKMCIDTYRGSGHWGQVWMQNGGGATIDSYDTRTDKEKIRPPIFDEESSDAWRANLPKVSAEHIDWMEALPITYEDDDFLYVHAGINPENEFREQYEEDLLWIRNRFINYPHNFKKRVVFGHTPFEKAQVLSNKIGIDTGCVYGNKLTAICLDTMTLYEASHNDKDECVQ